MCWFRWYECFGGGMSTYFFSVYFICNAFTWQIDIWRGCVENWPTAQISFSWYNFITSQLELKAVDMAIHDVVESHAVSGSWILSIQQICGGMNPFFSPPCLVVIIQSLKDISGYRRMEIWLVVWVLWPINLCWLFNDKSIFIQIISSILNNSV